jgi:hypothetical protein
VDHYEMRQAYLRALQVQKEMLESQHKEGDEDEQEEPK